MELLHRAPRRRPLLWRLGSEAISYERDDFWATTSNKQLNFIQHIKSLLKIKGRAAVVIPDNVLFFDRRAGSAQASTKRLWVYDLPTNQHFTLKTKRMTRADLDEFEACYRPGDRHSREATWSEANPEGRWRSFSYEEILARDKVSLDLFWLRDESLEDSANLPEPHLLAQEIADDLRSALAQIEDVLGDLELRVGIGQLEEA